MKKDIFSEPWRTLWKVDRQSQAREDLAYYLQRLGWLGAMIQQKAELAHNPVALACVHMGLTLAAGAMDWGIFPEAYDVVENELFRTLKSRPNPFNDGMTHPVVAAIASDILNPREYTQELRALEELPSHQWVLATWLQAIHKRMPRKKIMEVLEGSEKFTNEGFGLSQAGRYAAAFELLLTYLMAHHFSEGTADADDPEAGGA